MSSKVSPINRFRRGSLAVTAVSGSKNAKTTSPASGPQSQISHPNVRTTELQDEEDILNRSVSPISTVRNLQDQMKHAQIDHDLKIKQQITKIDGKIHVLEAEIRKLKQQKETVITAYNINKPKSSRILTQSALDIIKKQEEEKMIKARIEEEKKKVQEETRQKEDTSSFCLVM